MSIIDILESIICLISQKIFIQEGLGFRDIVGLKYLRTNSVPITRGVLIETVHIRLISCNVLVDTKFTPRLYWTRFSPVITEYS